MYNSKVYKQYVLLDLGIIKAAGRSVYLFCNFTSPLGNKIVDYKLQFENNDAVPPHFSVY